VPAYITAAVADPGRPAEDSKRDADRKPAEVLAFAGVKPGAKVVDFVPGKGYFTRIFAKVVGAKGKVYAYQPVEIDKEVPDELGALKALAAQYPNVTVIDQPVAAFAVPEAVDLVWTSQNYHDLHDPFMGSPDVARIDKAVYDALKPGGIFLVLDHAAAPGSGLANTNDLHRIDPQTVKQEVTAAGFEFVGASEVLRNPADAHTLKVFDPSIRGRTDQFIFKFRKPLK
jgi:predicted methyltransferase